MTDQPENPDDYIVQSFTIRTRVKRNPEKEDPNEPQWEFVPGGERVGPSDLILMCTNAINWVVLGQALARQKAAERSKIVVPVGGGRGKVLRVN